jgi:cytochrome d ubiquinol oxidase subunit I
MIMETLSRWQFGVTITYHFLFVPLTIGLALLVAVMQVLAYRRRDETWDRLARFFGSLFLINFAMGIVTGCGCSAATGCPRWRTRSRSAW